ncbi:uncharacterized protein LOC110736003 [Chenopodium quinoa]|uniref:uncharacterized protein LOC110736003 n=1 Tax=Chenopodium quinoa TaxID=63459 RepID=UPI000B782851|nr:uncharacterized protein LOC110736003 [Chenopodium quinoa]
MSGEFEMSMMGVLNFFLGLKIKETEEGIMIHQQKYIKELIKKYKLDNAKTNKTPTGTGTTLDEDPSGTCIDQTMYRGMIGSLLYLTASRSDISFSVGLCVRFQANPKESHLIAVKRILRYLKGTDDLSLFYPRSNAFDLNFFTDADYAEKEASTIDVLQRLREWKEKKAKSKSLEEHIEEVKDFAEGKLHNEVEEEEEMEIDDEQKSLEKLFGKYVVGYRLDLSWVKKSRFMEFLDLIFFQEWEDMLVKALNNCMYPAAMNEFCEKIVVKQGIISSLINEVKIEFDVETLGTILKVPTKGYEMYVKGCEGRKLFRWRHSGVSRRKKRKEYNEP